MGQGMPVCQTTQSVWSPHQGRIRSPSDKPSSVSPSTWRWWWYQKGPGGPCRSLDVLGAVCSGSWGWQCMVGTPVWKMFRISQILPGICQHCYSTIHVEKKITRTASWVQLSEIKSVEDLLVDRQLQCLQVNPLCQVVDVHSGKPHQAED